MSPAPALEPRRPVHWTDLTEPQRRAVLALDAFMPVHEGYAARKLAINPQTIAALIGRELVQREFYQQRRIGVRLSFITLTSDGAELAREYLCWLHQIGEAA